MGKGKLKYEFSSWHQGCLGSRIRCSPTLATTTQIQKQITSSFLQPKNVNNVSQITGHDECMVSSYLPASDFEAACVPLNFLARFLRSFRSLRAVRSFFWARPNYSKEYTSVYAQMIRGCDEGICGSRSELAQPLPGTIESTTVSRHQNRFRRRLPASACTLSSKQA